MHESVLGLPSHSDCSHRTSHENSESERVALGLGQLAVNATMGIGSARRGHLACTERNQVGSNPTFSTNFCPCDGMVDVAGLDPVAERRGSSTLPVGTNLSL